MEMHIILDPDLTMDMDILKNKSGYEYPVYGKLFILPKFEVNLFLNSLTSTNKKY